ncbi:MAG: ankyrin repeat domain-containing protein [Clostridiales bacterium]|nr:ankyrin repeat domain-containing protein [Clostridiales bacterium]
MKENDSGRVRFLMVMPGSINYHYFYGDGYGDTPLEVACKKKNYEMMELLLQNGAKPNSPDGFAQPVDFVFGGMEYEGVFNCTKLLVAYGADLNIRGSRDSPTIYRLMTRSDYINESTLKAANDEVLKTLEYVVEHGGSVEARYPRDAYLSYVVENKNYGALTYLFDECGVDINGQDVFGKSALMRAAELGNLEMVVFLIGYGADVYLYDNDGKTAVDFAGEGGFADIAKCLEEQ